MKVAHTKFISVEGSEGVGKSLFCSGLVSYLEGLGQEVISTREPGGTVTAQKIRQLFMHPPEEDPLTPQTELFLVSAARSQHIETKILPFLQSGGWVICDRFYDSTRVYQGRGSIDKKQLELILSASVGDTHPSLTFLLDCDTDVALSRVTKRAEETGLANRFDQASQLFHARLRQGFLDVAKEFPERIVVLDASQSVDKVLEDAKATLQNRFRSVL